MCAIIWPISAGWGGRGAFWLAGAHAELSRRRPADLCGPRRRGASFGDRLSGRRAMDRGRRGKGVVRAGQIQTLVPPAAERMAGRRAGVAHLCGSGFLMVFVMPALVAGIHVLLGPIAKR